MELRWPMILPTTLFDSWQVFLTQQSLVGTSKSAAHYVQDFQYDNTHYLDLGFLLHFSLSRWLHWRAPGALIPVTQTSRISCPRARSPPFCCWRAMHIAQAQATTTAIWWLLMLLQVAATALRCQRKAGAGQTWLREQPHLEQQ